MPTYQEERLTEIADAIRAKEGSTEPIVATTFAERIGALSTGSSGVRSFNGRTGIVVPSIDDYTAEMVGALSEDGGTLYGDLRIKGEGSTFGNKINFGDGENVQISEPEDDCLEIKAKKINFVTTDATDQKFTLNGVPIETAGGEEIVTVTSFNNRTGDVIPQVGDYTSDMVGAVPVTRTINGIPLSDDITLTAENLGINADIANLINRTTAVNVEDTAYGTVMARGIYMGTTDLTAGSSSLTSGVIYLVYE